jgi:tartronate-semialdehyde synthase
MAKMRAIDAAVRVLESEGITHAFGIPGAAINPLYSALKARGSIAHVLARHVEGASHMAEGYTRAAAGNIGVCIGTSGPAGTDMITGLYSASADSIPILCITGQAPRARLYKEDFQAVDIESIAKPVTKWAVTVREPALVPRVFQQAFHVMRSGRPGPVLIDLPFDVQMGEIEFDPDTYEPLPVYKPAATRAQVEKALAMLNESARPLIVAGGGIINADASDLLVQLAEVTGVPVIPTLMGWGTGDDRGATGRYQRLRAGEENQCQAGCRRRRSKEDTVRAKQGRRALRIDTGARRGRIQRHGVSGKPITGIRRSWRT